MPHIPTNPFGKTDLQVSRVGFGAWAIGGPAMAGDVAIGWGSSDDDQSRRAIKAALNRGVTFFDTADFYGLGHSERLIGEIVGSREDVVVATKVGHRLNDDGTISLDYSREHILRSCDASLKRLRRERIDVYQLHSARLPHLEAGDCIDAMEELVRAGKVRCWGLSLNTYAPEPEAAYMIEQGFGHAFQLVLSVINQRAVGVMQRAAAAGYGIIARMPLHFGLLAGKFDVTSRFDRTDHRSFRLTPEVLERALEDLEPYFALASARKIPPAALALAFVMSHPEVSTVIPGIRTPEQAEMNTRGPFELPESDVRTLANLYRDRLSDLLTMMKEEESR